jgi:hypothetical protein
MDVLAPTTTITPGMETEWGWSVLTPTPVMGTMYGWRPPPKGGNALLSDATQQKSLMFVAICLGVMGTLAAPMVWLWVSDRIKRRRMDPFRKQRDLESAAKASQKRLKIRPGANPPPYRELMLKDTNPFHGSLTTKPPRAITADQILGTDKASYMRGIVPQSGSLAFTRTESVC